MTILINASLGIWIGYLLYSLVSLKTDRLKIALINTPTRIRVICSFIAVAIVASVVGSNVHNPENDSLLSPVEDADTAVAHHHHPDTASR